MRSVLRPAVTAASLLALAACASLPAGGDTTAVAVAPDSSLGQRGDGRSITRADLARATQLSLLDFIRAERPQWLRGPDGRPAPVTVYLDDALVGGGTAALRDISLNIVVLVRYYDVSAAQQRYTSRIRTPVVSVSTR